MELGVVQLIAVLLPALTAPFFPALIGKIKKTAGYWAMSVPIASLALIASNVQKGGLNQVVSLKWIPELGINASFLVDGVSVFFGTVVCVMGALVCFYAHHYLHETQQKTGRFYAYLLLFMTAMLGTVFSNNIFLMFVFWELTGIASFLLIGFNYDQVKSQRGALMALLVTGSTGLVMLVGLILISIYTNITDISHLLTIAPGLTHIQSSLTVAMMLIIVGAFAKSAQFPFHFWLPNAMSAPTPISAYLHSAAMVKLGVFLIARFYPIFVENPMWAPTLITVGIITMVLGGVFSVLTHDIKGVLAYTTVSQLGFLVATYGLGSTSGVQHDFYHILNHVFYKGALFMVAGIAIHTFHTQDLRKMSGLFKFAPLAGFATIASVLAMVGFPGTTGFISKELMIDTLLQASGQGGLYTLLPILIVISATCLVVSGFRVISIFFGPLKNLSKEHIHVPSIAFQMAPLVLAGATIAFGLFPADASTLLSKLAVPNLHLANPSHLAIWHGINMPLLISISVLLSGTGLFYFAHQKQWVFAKLPKFLQLDLYFDLLLRVIQKGACKITTGLRTDSPMDYLPIILGFFVTIVGLVLFPIFSYYIAPFMRMDYAGTVEIVTASLIALSSLGVVIAKKWMSRLVSLSIAGFLISFYFILYKAPDLALTQIMIEAVGIVLILLLLVRIPQKAEENDNRRVPFSARKVVNIIISIGMAVCATSLIVLMTHNQVLESIAPYFIENTNALAGGSNAVNTILVDFRGFDTMGELSVLVIATLGIMGLTWKTSQKITKKQTSLSTLTPTQEES